MEPTERIRRLTGKGDLVEVDNAIPIRRYYRAGQEMVRMASINFDKDQFEAAYVLYLRFLTLFVERITKHPDYKTFSEKLKEINVEKLKEVLPIVEKLKNDIFLMYTEEYNEKKQPVKSPVKPAVKSPVKPAVKSPVKPPVQSPAKPPVQSPVKPPVQSPVRPPVQSPVRPPVQSPVKPTVQSPVQPKQAFDFVDGVRRHHVVIPADTVRRFKETVADSTDQNIESCGFLYGRYQGTVNIITHLLITKQEGTSTMCSPLDTTDVNNEFLNFKLTHNLVQMGWIHTHPTFTAFFSSIDLHTHFGFERDLPSHIGIVCGQNNDNKIYKLTEAGTNLIRDCAAGFTFHEHNNSDTPLYQVAKNVDFDPAGHIAIVDTRYD